LNVAQLALNLESQKIMSSLSDKDELPHGTSEKWMDIAHVLFLDIVGFSKLRSDRQLQILELLHQVIRA
jgi:hypothetical protein